MSFCNESVINIHVFTKEALSNGNTIYTSFCSFSSRLIPCKSVFQLYLFFLKTRGLQLYQILIQLIPCFRTLPKMSMCYYCLYALVVSFAFILDGVLTHNFEIKYVLHINNQWALFVVVFIINILRNCLIVCYF